jgi:hypothetical protein
VTTSTTDDLPPVPGCPGDRSEPPPGAATAEVPDVDGDGRIDLVWAGAGAGGRRPLGLLLSGRGPVETTVDSASPQPISVLVADVDERGPAELLVSDGRQAQLLVLVECRITPVLGPDGLPYRFDLGFGDQGTGVGCVDADGDGRRDLVGLRARPPEGAVVPWTRTVVALDGERATNGATTSGSFRTGPDDAAIDLLSRVSCGDRVLPEDGVTAPQP